LIPVKQKEYGFVFAEQNGTFPFKKDAILIGELPSDIDTGPKLALLMAAKIEMKWPQMAYHQHEDELQGEVCGMWNCCWCQILPKSWDIYKSSKISKLAPPSVLLEGFAIDHPMQMTVAQMWWTKRRLIYPLQTGKMANAYASLTANIDRILSGKEKKQESIAAMQAENEMIIDMLNKQRQDEIGEHEIFQMDDDGFYPGLTEEEKELAQTHQILGRTLVAMAEIDVNTKIAKEKKKEDGKS
jgi:hypothetical protein